MSNFVPALSRTRNFFELYQYVCGISEVPPVYNFWASLSLVSAALEDRVWFEKFKDSKLFPNLYIFLIGPGGLGKGTAISTAVRMADRSVQIPKYRGSATAASLIDVLGKVERDEYGRRLLSNPKLWLIMDELKNNLGTNVNLVEAFIALMTEMYTADYVVNTSTRKHGQVDILEPVVNWLIGTTESDLRDILSKKLIDSGFTARVCFIFGDYDFNKRCPRIVYPPDYDEVMEHLQARLFVMQNTHGKICMTPQAEAEMDKWYITRPNPEEEALFSIWKRQHDMLLKFAMLNAVADGGPPVIRTVHLRRAKATTTVLTQNAEKLLEVAHETPDTKPSNEVARYLRLKGTVDHSQTLRYFRRMRGMNAKKLQEAIRDLYKEGVIRYERTDRGGVLYHWEGG